MGSNTTAYLMKDNHANSIIVAGKQIDNVPILMTEFLVFRDEIVSAMQLKLQKIAIESDSQLVISSIHGTTIPKKITNFMEDKRRLSMLLEDVLIKHCSRVCNMKPTIIAKKAHMYLV